MDGDRDRLALCRWQSPPIGLPEAARRLLENLAAAAHLGGVGGGRRARRVLAAWQAEVAFWMRPGRCSPPGSRRCARTWARGGAGYEDAARWMLAGMAAGVFACGTLVLLWMEVTAGVQATRLT